MDNINYKQLFEQLVIEKENINAEKNIINNRVKELEKQNEELKQHLKKYTSHQGGKKYYEKNRETIIERNKEYNKTHKRVIDPEKIKEYNKRAYEKRKQKKEKENLEKNII